MIDCMGFPQIRFKVKSAVKKALLDHLLLTADSRRAIFDGIAFIETGSNRTFYPAIRKNQACIDEFEVALYNKRYKTSLVAGIVTIQENTLDYCLKIING